MALTRKQLKALNLTEEQIDTIIDLHTEVTDAFKGQITDYQAKVKELEEAQGANKGKDEKIDELTKALEAAKNEKSELEKANKTLEEFKTKTEAATVKAAKEKAARAYYKSKNIKDDNIGLAVGYSRSVIDALEVDESGAIKDTTALDDLISGELSKLVTKSKTVGVQTATPPTSGGKPSKTREEIEKITDTAERQKAIAENPELFGIN